MEVQRSSPGRISQYEIYMLGDDDTDELVVKITNPVLSTGGGTPQDGGPHDLRLGITGSGVCLTCHNERPKCPGHTGYIQSNYPIQNQTFESLIIPWLRALCHHCGSFVVKNDEKHDLKTLADKAKPKSKKSGIGDNSRIIEPVECHNCQREHFWTTNAKDNPTKKMVEIIENKKVVGEKIIYNHQIRKIFDRVTQEMMDSIGIKMSNHPSKLILYKIRVPTTHIRPDPKRLNGQRDNTNATTAVIIKIQNMVEDIPPINDDTVIDDELGAQLIKLDDYIHSMLTRTKQASQSKIQSTREFVGTLDGEPVSIRKNMTGKYGLVRNSLKGHRFMGSARSPITPDPSVPPGYLGFPLDMCMELTVEMTVNSGNIEEANRYFQNGPNNYPGAVDIKKAGGGTFDIKGGSLNRGMVEEGDKLYRHVIAGDVLIFNRQPSLRWLSIGAHIIIPMEGDTFRMNVSDCNRYNADFDGDVAQIYILNNQMALAEARILTAVHRLFVSHQTMDPMMGAFQDGLILLFRLTRSGFKLNRSDTANILRLVPGSQKLTKKEYTGREIVSMMFPRGFNYEAVPASHLKAYADIIGYKEDESELIIENGQIIKGVLDKGSVGQTTKNSLFQKIHNSLSGRDAVDLVSKLQLITNAMVDIAPATVSLGDIHMDPKKVEKVHSIVNGILDKAEQITNDIHNGSHRPPIGMTFHEYTESRYLSTLSLPDNIIEAVYEGIDFKDNGFVDLIMSGSKGKKTNLQAVLGAIGQSTVQSKRPEMVYGPSRTYPYFHRWSQCPIAHGFVANNFVNGITFVEMLGMAHQNRDAMTTNSLMTAISGELSRYMCRNLESYQVDTLNRVSDGRRVLFTSTEFDLTINTTVTFPTVSGPFADFEKNYRTKPADVKKFKTKHIAGLLDEEWNQMVQDREDYRNIYLNAERRTFHSNTFSNRRRQPVDVNAIVVDIVKNHGVDSKKSLSPQYCIPAIQKLCKRIPYVFVNETCWERDGYKLPDRYETACTNVKILIRSICNYKTLSSLGVNDSTLEIIINEIYLALSNAVVDYGFQVGLISAQSIAEPSTQMTLDSKHSVGRGGTKTDSLTKLKEILGARSTDKMANPTSIMFLADHSKWSDYDEVKRIAGSLEMIQISQFTKSTSILIESFGEIRFKDYISDERIFKDFKRYSRTKLPSLANWCIRYEFNRIEMINKSIGIDDVVIRLKNEFPTIFPVYSDPNDPDSIVLRVYFLQKENIDGKYVRQMMETLRNTTIRGIDGLQNFEVIQINRSYIKKDESIADQSVYAISCDGSNIAECFNFCDIIDPELILSDSPNDVFENFGIEIARQKVSDELRGLMDTYGVAPYHCELLATELCRTGASGISNISMGSLRTRENDNPALAMIYGDVMSNLTRAAMSSRVYPTRSGAPNYVLGQKPRVGTSYSDILVNESAFVQEDVDDLIADL